MAANPAQVVDRNIRPLYDENAPQVLDERFGEKRAALRNIVLLEDVETGRADRLHELMELWDEADLAMRLIGHGGKQHKS